MNALVALKKQLKVLVVENLQKALKQFQASLTTDSSKNNAIILLMARYENNRNKQNLDLIGNQEALEEENKISYALLEYIDALKEEEVKLDADTSNKITYESINGEQILLDLDLLEKQGLKAQAELLLEKIKRIKSALILEDDPTRQMKYEMQVVQAEKHLKMIKEQL